MATKIRLQRGGRKSYAFYRIVIADSRAPRMVDLLRKLVLTTLTPILRQLIWILIAHFTGLRLEHSRQTLYAIS